MSVRELRELGRDMRDRGSFEIDLSSGSVEWVNDFALSVMGLVPDQIASMSVFDMTPERFHEMVREEVVQEPSAKGRRFYIFPTRTAAGSVAWWYVFKTEVRGTRRWAFAEHIQDTPTSGAEFAFMAMQMDTLSMHASLESRMDDLEAWVRDQVREVHEEVDGIRDGLLRVEEAASNAAREAAAAKTAVLSVQREISKFATKEEIQGHFDKFDKMAEDQSKFSTEILRLIKTDTLVEERIKAYEAHVKKTTEAAVKAIESQVTKSGKGLSRKVTIPVALITILATAIQFALHYFGIKLVP